jgi:hypothetical protein
MGFWKIWALLVIALVIIGWIRGKHFLAFSIAGFIGLGGLMVLDRASEATPPFNSILSAGFFVAVPLSTSRLIANHFKSS